MTTDSGININYVCVTANQPDTKSTVIPALTFTHIATAEQHAAVSIQLNIVTCSTYPDKFLRGRLSWPALWSTFRRTIK